MAERRYDEREVAEILRAAAESQAAGHDSVGTGLTLGDIQRLAGEVGIDAAHVDAAVASRNSPGSTRNRRFHIWGAPSQIVRERTFTGTLDDSAWEESVAGLRARYGQPGAFAVLGETREWSASLDGMIVHVSAKTQNGRTRTRMMLNQGGGVAVSWILTVTIGFVFVLGIAVSMGKAGVPIPTILATIGALVGVVYGLVNRALSRWNGRNIAMAEEFMRSVEEHLQSESDLRSRLTTDASGVETGSTQVST